MFALQNAPRRGRSPWASWRWSRWSRGDAGAKFDLPVDALARSADAARRAPSSTTPTSSTARTVERLAAHYPRSCWRRPWPTPTAALGDCRSSPAPSASTARRRAGTRTGAAVLRGPTRATSCSRRRRRATPGRARRWCTASARSPTRELDRRANRARAPPLRLRRRPGGARRRSASSARPELVVALLGDAQGRRRLRAARPRATRRAPGVHARGRGRRRCCSPQQRLAGAAARARARRSCSWIALAGGDAPATSPPRPRPPSRRDDLAYVIYTSGSTGRPKGVMIAAPRRSCRLCAVARTTSGSTPDERAPPAAPASFDASTLEIWGRAAHRRDRSCCYPAASPTRRTTSGELILRARG